VERARGWVKETAVRGSKSHSHFVRVELEELEKLKELAMLEGCSSSYWRDKVEDFCVHFVKWQNEPIMIQVIVAIGAENRRGQKMMTLRCWRWDGTTRCWVFCRESGQPQDGKDLGLCYSSSCCCTTPGFCCSCWCICVCVCVCVCWQV